MRSNSLYRKYFKDNMFMRFTLIVSCIFIATIIAFSYLVLMLISDSAVQRQMDIQRKTMESISNYVENKYQSVQDMMRDVYRDGSLASNTTFLLEHPFGEYVEHRLDRYLLGDQTTSNAVQYFQNKIDDDPDIRSLMLYSANQQVMYYYDNRRQFERVSTNAAHSFVPDSMVLDEESLVSVPNIWVLKSIGMQRTPMFSVKIPITNKSSLLNIGQLLVYFDSESIWQAMNNYKQDFKGEILVLSAQNEVIFDTSGQGYGRKYLQLQGANSGEEISMGGMLVTSLTQSQAGYTVVSLISKKELAETYSSARNTIVTIALVCILFAVLLPAMFISNFAKRTHRIIRFTRKVKNGDLNTRIIDNREDELGQIAKSFNSMLDELNQYIDQVYKAEIKQKHTEIATLEARVNPHFLYNTLEVIRMRAISSGAKDVGEMIYSLSVLFKSYVRPKVKYTFKDELEACRMYLELFRIRYKDRFSYTIECSKELEPIPVLKMSLQPVIENYILHGMRTGQTGNVISIRVHPDDHNNIRVVVTDNGLGIAGEKLNQLRLGLEDNRELSGSESFGLRSIHERLRLMYGKPYGVELASEAGAGTEVTITFPYPVKEETDHV
ncbi:MULTISPECIES: cache domain-containing sensor histidine kinase [Paenibacillus]|jgi:two-component system, sensor histidine kinase YesM|uniref:cache domain-containing sensor histidine kinase n=1 Tax=Paenibacillus TaxID=44249 RepID=UPI0004F6D6C3|nr:MULTISPECIES: sensor histidine kinase [unclassified Paenibacillus]AIQ31248.1 histidine kinase [Paenibacillus sp. FSL P4-0081]OMF27312.1 two-component sensor histidine kinase [Paenibacillus sp. FSL H8-0259]